MRKFLCLATLFVASTMLSGCGGNYYMLSSKFVMSTQSEDVPEINETPTYKSVAPFVKTVAVKAPDGCSNRTADERTGVAVSQEAVLKTNCGVEMAEIERALSKASYKVISWKVLEREMEGKQLSALDVANKLGAELLFQINSLEKSTKTLGKDARWERSYYLSNAYAEPVEEKAFDEDSRTYLKQKFLLGYENSVNLKRPAVTLDANVVYVKGGESIWFYRWTHSDPAASSFQHKVLLWCKKALSTCYSLDAEPRFEKTARDVVTSGDSEAVSISDRPEDRDKALYNVLLKSVIDNLVKSFAHK